MLSIQGKLTFILVSLIAPLVVVSVLSVEMIDAERERVMSALQGAEFISKVWNAGLDEGAAKQALVLQEDLHPDFRALVGDLSKPLTTISNPDAPRHMRLRAAYDITVDVAGKSKLINLLSEETPTLAAVLFDKAPELAFRVEYLLSIVKKLQTKDEFNRYDAMSIQIAAGQFKTLADSVSMISNAVPLQLDGEAKGWLTDLGASYRADNSKLQSEMAKIVLGSGDYVRGSDIKIDTLLPVGDAFGARLLAFWRGGMTVAIRRINEERERLNLLYAFEVGSLGVLVVFGVGASVLMRRSIIQQTRKLQEAYSKADQQNRALEEMRQHAEHESMHDALTGLANRRFMEREIRKRLKTAKEKNIGLAVLHIDLDRFKQINDTLGHAAGDHVLQHVAKVLNRETREDDVVARVGGDEFLVLSFSNGQQEPLGKMAKRIIDSLSRPIHYMDNLCQFGASVGINIVFGDDLNEFDSDLFLSNADIALYRAKETGRGRFVFFSHALRSEVEISKSLSDDLILGLQKREFFPVYQPQVDARTGECIGVEALARWNHPHKGSLSPAVFIPMARRLGLLGKLDECIMEQALVDLRSWDSIGLHVPRLSLNLSEHRLADSEFLTWLETHDLPDGRLSFEVLETVFSDDFDDVRRYAVDRLQELNIGLEMDDFGTGHASLAGLLSFSPCRLKIAREIAGPVDTSARHAKLVSGIIDVAEALDIEVLAEGVEREKQAQILRDLGCDALQGYLFAVPMPASELPKWWHLHSATGQRKSG